MLVRFAVENFMSFKDRQVFSMAAGKATRHDNHIAKIKGKRILKGGFLFGANASGKSNLVRAIDFAREVILRGSSRASFHEKYFKLNKENEQKPGVFQFDIIVNDTMYSYGFAIKYQTRKIMAEWLYENEKREKCIFNRYYDEEGKKKYDTELSIDNQEQNTRFTIYCDDVKEQRLLLSDIVERSSEDVITFRVFHDIMDWFRKLTIIFPDTHINTSRLVERTQIVPVNDMLSFFMKYFDTGIQEVTSEFVEIDNVLGTMSANVREKLIEKIAYGLVEDDTAIVGVEIEGKRYEFKLNDEGKIVACQLKMNHGSKENLFDLDDESDGTQRLFDLIPLYELARRGNVVIVDELDRSLHSKLTLEFIKLFYERTEGIATQMIATTHDGNVMDLDLLRQDEIWFIEREKDFSTQIYSLNKYSIRFDKKVDKDYLLGRYGAIPVFNQSALLYLGEEDNLFHFFKTNLMKENTKARR